MDGLFHFEDKARILNSKSIIAYVAVVIIGIFLCGCDPRYGFLESKFQLSQESPLPKWATGLKHYSRKQLSMEIDMFSFRDLFSVYGPQHKLLKVYTGEDHWLPITKYQLDKLQKYGGNIPYPEYSVITVNGIPEIFEQKRPEPFLYVNDNPKFIPGEEKVRGENK